MIKIILVSLVSVGFLVAMPLTVNALDSQIVSQNFDDEVKVHISQVHPPYQIGYTVHYRSPRDRKWILAGFHAERRDAERAARRLQRSGFRTQIRSLAAAERRRTGDR
ncbi:hypothetical protein [Chamaesiphon minutus]|uniref:Sporulation related protein n=1 Tax=Chamaesiphon minutus (strain ATCC 27169 / PCC 6605) TaxID=1173020 RepID=K9UN35_CHAP6|nr:hypothetical protein [Chamaesiphon minutus]AFY96517.1 hypothetical protein Cha6605_5653 [Chamaesiphon minutus PCC 6605]